MDCPEIDKFSRLGFAQYLVTGQVSDTRFDRNVTSEKLLNATKWHGYRF